MNTRPKLISFKLCPFVQKAVILLRVKQIDYDIEYIDLAAPPEWFLQISPQGKVPVLKLDKEIIFESSVILEYLDEAYPPQLHPADLIKKARNRSWIEYSSTCLIDIFNLKVAETEHAFAEKLSLLHEHFDRVEEVLTARPYFNGESFSIVDVSFAPVFYHLRDLQLLNPVIFDNDRHPRISEWRHQLLEHPAVEGSTVADFSKLHQQMIWKRQGYISSFLDADLFEPANKKSTY